MSIDYPRVGQRRSGAHSTASVWTKTDLLFVWDISVLDRAASKIAVRFRPAGRGSTLFGDTSTTGTPRSGGIRAGAGRAGSKADISACPRNVRFVPKEARSKWLRERAGALFAHLECD